MKTTILEDSVHQLASLYHMSNNNGMTVSMTSLGATVTSVMVPDKSGQFSNVVLELKDQQAYFRNTAFFGATIGRYANRIAHATTTIDGTKLIFTKNEGDHHLHGGQRGLHKVVWNIVHESSDCLIFTCTSHDGDEGYPGNLFVRAVFKLTADNELVIAYHGTTDKTTPLNLTNHSYFNLSGDPSTSILNHNLYLAADSYTPVHNDLIPIGEIAPVANTVFDFTTARSLGSRIDVLDGGYDHNFVLHQNRPASAPIAALHDPESGRFLEVSTSKPGIQVYTGGNLDGSHISPCGTPLMPYSGVCLETQFFPNAPNVTDFPDGILRPGQTYYHTTTYRFSVRS